jgi:hypothetical protein
MTTDAPARYSIPLPRIAPDESVDEVLWPMSRRRLRGAFGLGVLLDVCSGERARRAFPERDGGGGGALTETFLALFPGGPLRPGIYHYDARRHRLDQVRDGDWSAAMRAASIEAFDRFQEPPFGLVAFCAPVDGPMRRAPEVRSAGAPFTDVGHTLMAYRAVLRRLGIGGGTSLRFRDRQLADLLGCDAERLAPLVLGTLV